MTMTTQQRQEWLGDLRAALDPLLRDAQNYATFGPVKPPTERQFADALNAIRYARWCIRDARREAKLAANEGAMSDA